jgi:hypothetical protein
MSLIVKVGGRESNSFTTLAEADEIILAEGFPDDSAEWEDLEEEAKNYRLILGAEIMCKLPLGGLRVYCGQALAFPRTNQVNDHIIPLEVKETQCFLSYSVIHRGLAARPDAASETETGANVKSVSLGGLLSVSFEGRPIENGTVLDKAIRSSQFPAYMRMKRYMQSFRGVSVRDADELATCRTTTTTSTT